MRAREFEIDAKERLSGGATGSLILRLSGGATGSLILLRVAFLVMWRSAAAQHPKLLIHARMLIAAAAICLRTSSVPPALRGRAFLYCCLVFPPRAVPQPCAPAIASSRE